MCATVDELDDLDEGHQQDNVEEGGEAGDDSSGCGPGGGILNEKTLRLSETEIS